MSTELERKARRIIVASVLYYSFNLSPISDGEFDRLCVEVAAGWEDLHPLRRWQLGSAGEIKASGFTVKTTYLTLAWAIGEAERLLEQEAGTDFRVYHVAPWKFSKRHRVHWLNVGQFQIKDIRK